MKKISILLFSTFIMFSCIDEKAANNKIDPADHSKLELSTAEKLLSTMD